MIGDDRELILSRFRLSRAPSLPLLARHLSVRAPPAWVFGPLRDITRVQPHHLRRRPSPPLRSVLRLSQPLDVLLRTRARRLISSRCHVQDPSVQGLLSPRSHPSSSEGAPPLPLLRRVLTDFRRLPHTSDLGFEVFIRARARSMLRRYSQRCPPLPSSGSSPPGSHRSRSIAAYLRSPLTTFARRAFAVRDRAGSSSSASIPREARRCVSAPPACSSFRAFFQISVLVTPPAPSVAGRRAGPGGSPLARLPVRPAIASRSRAGFGCPIRRARPEGLRHACSISAR